MEKRKKTKIILVDDHKIIRDGLSSLLQGEPDLEVVAQASSGREAIKQVRKFLPDVIIIDIAMKDINGIEATSQITAKFPDTKVIALSMHSDRRYVEGMLKAGALGYMLKESAYTELINAIQTVTSDDIYLSPPISRVMAGDYISSDNNHNHGLSTLTGREIEVLTLLTGGQSVKQIALSFHLSVKTIETHRQKIMKKLDIHNIPELTKFAIREGLSTI